MPTSTEFPLSSSIAQAVVLTGGESRRMGREKASIEIDGQPIIVRELRVLQACFERVFLVGKKPTALEQANVSVDILPDDFPNCGPVGGIATALRRASAEWLFVAACDMPFLNADVIERLWRERSNDSDAIVPCQAEKVHPLAAFYARRSRRVWEEALHDGNLRVRSVLKKLHVRYVEFPSADRTFTNVNTPECLADHLSCEE